MSMRTTIEFGSADLLIATHANIFPRAFSASAPHVVVTSTSGNVRPIAIALHRNRCASYALLCHLYTMYYGPWSSSRYTVDSALTGRHLPVAREPTSQHVLDTALAFAVTNRHYDVADFLLDHGADINTNWNSHEPASLLHHLVFVHRDHEAMQFLIDAAST